MESNKIKLSEVRELVRDILKEEKEDKNPCWKGYQQLGMKMKNGKEVPNCVPVNEEETCNECNENKSKNIQKIKLSEVRELVRKSLKESNDDNYNVIDLDANIDDSEYFAFGIIKPLKKIMVFKNYGSAARIYDFFIKKYKLKPVDANNFTVIHSGSNIDINKIPKKYKSFEII